MKTGAASRSDAPSVGGGEQAAAASPSPVASVMTVEAAVPPRPARRDRRDRPPAGTALWVGATSLSVLGALLLAFVAQLSVVGGLEQARDQRVAYQQLRSELAQATAPVAQVDDQGTLLALGSPVALLEIPAIGVRQVVLEGTTSGVLQSGPGHRRDTVLPGQVGGSVIMGRRAAYGGPFAHLGALRPGDLVVVTTGQGRNTFEVTGIRRPGQVSQVRPLAAGSGRLTLITATGSSYLPQDAIRVDAALTSAVQATPAPMLRVGSLPQSEAPLAGDREAWVTVVLWAQATLLASLVLAAVVRRWGRWQTWVVAAPLLTWLGLTLADQVARLLPNLM